MNYFKEAVLRWKGQTPPWFKKTQGILTAVAAMGTTIAGISVTSGKLSWITVVGGVLLGAGTIGGAVCQFVVSVATVVLDPGESIQNQTNTPIPVTVQASVEPVTQEPKETDPSIQPTQTSQS